METTPDDLPDDSRATALLSGRYAPWRDLSQAPDRNHTRAWVKLLTGYDPSTQYGWVGAWENSLELDDGAYVDVSGLTGQFLRVSGATEGSREHRVVRIHAVHPEADPTNHGLDAPPGAKGVLFWEPVPDRVAIDVLGLPRGEDGLRLEARAALDAAEADQVARFIAEVAGTTTPDVLERFGIAQSKADTRGGGQGD